MKINDTEITVQQADITTLKVDAIVNAANNELVMGGGVAGAIKRKGGKEIEAEAVRQAPIAIGETVVTKAGSLPSRYVIHAATMGMDFLTDEHKIRSSCRNSLKRADELKLSSIAFPALGCGTGGFAPDKAAKIMAQEVYRLIREKKTSLNKIIFCVYTKEAFATFEKEALGYLRYVVEHIANGPFLTVDAIIEIQGGVIVIERKNPPFGWALPGGFVNYGESLEEAVRREVREETAVELDELRQFGVYSSYDRDPRFHTVSVVFAGRARGIPQAGDDAAGLTIIRPSEIEQYTLAFDHQQVLKDYFKQYSPR